MASQDYYLLKRAEAKADLIGKQSQIIGETIQSGFNTAASMYSTYLQSIRQNNQDKLDTLKAVAEIRVSNLRAQREAIELQGAERAEKNAILEDLTDAALLPTMERINNQFRTGDLATQASSAMEYNDRVAAMTEAGGDYRPSAKLREIMYQITDKFQTYSVGDMTMQDFAIALRNPENERHQEALDRVRQNSSSESWAKIEKLLPSASIAEQKVRLKAVPTTADAIKDVKDYHEIMTSRFADIYKASGRGGAKARELASADAQMASNMIRSLIDQGLNSPDPEKVQEASDILTRVEGGDLSDIAAAMKSMNEVVRVRERDPSVRDMNIATMTQRLARPLNQAENAVRSVAGLGLNDAPGMRAATGLAPEVEDYFNNSALSDGTAVSIGGGIDVDRLAHDKVRGVYRSGDNSQSSVLSIIQGRLANKGPGGRGMKSKDQVIVEGYGNGTFKKSPYGGGAAKRTDGQVDIIESLRSSGVDFQSLSPSGQAAAIRNQGIAANAKAKVLGDTIKANATIDVATINAFGRARSDETRLQIAELNNVAKLSAVERQSESKDLATRLKADADQRDSELKSAALSLTRDKNIQDADRERRLGAIEKIRGANGTIRTLADKLGGESDPAPVLAAIKDQMLAQSQAYGEISGSPSPGASPYVKKNGQVYLNTDAAGTAQVPQAPSGSAPKTDSNFLVELWSNAKQATFRGPLGVAKQALDAVTEK